MTGATGALGRHALPALAAAGFEPVALARTSQEAALVPCGIAVGVSGPYDVDRLASLLDGCDTVCNLATRGSLVAAGLALRPWRGIDRLRTEGVRTLLEAAKLAGVRRVIQESVSHLYADAADEWVDERSPLSINAATEPASVGESLVQEFTCCSRVGVVLRLGAIVGDDDLTRRQLRAVRTGRPIGLGSPGAWSHLLHSDDIGSAVVAAMTAPSGVYNVGAEPVRRHTVMEGYGLAAGRRCAEFMGPLTARLAGSRTEPLTRSLRVSSSTFRDCTGWRPQRGSFDPSWLEAAGGLRRAPVMAGR